jgi:hypothetical protein
LPTSSAEVGIKGVGFGGADTYGPPFFNVQGFQPFGDSLLCTDRNDFAPRIGASYNPHGGRYVFRAGYGGFYAYPEMNLWCNQVHNVPLVFPEIRTSNNFIPSLRGFNFGDPVLGKTLVGFTALDPHWQIPFIQQASASVERQVGDAMVIEIGYTGAWGRNLDRSHLRIDDCRLRGARPDRRGSSGSIGVEGADEGQVIAPPRAEESRVCY